MGDMLPLLIVALLIWAGVFVFLMAVERRVANVERQISESRKEKIR